mmetsp:Transcript_2396/g.4013  ORF Transcript_2396/g.4013 Transcript_2396/m.4013 type:complete len:361 (-) Transcript_2396:378-1460(-)
MGKRARAYQPPESESEEEQEFDSEDVQDDEDEMDSAGGEEAEAGAGQPAKSGKGGSKRPDRPAIYDVEGLHERLEDIGWGEQATWEETQAISHEDPTVLENVDDDIARELAFYNQALSAAQQAIQRFNDSGQPWLRPQDFYAEMVKTDEHMAKVKEQLMFEQRAIEQSEERRKTRESKQYSKQVQAEKIKERNATKKRQIDEVSKQRKQREKSGFAGEHDYDAQFEAMDKPAGRAAPQHSRLQDRGGPGGPNKGGAGALNKKRVARDSKYGFGGAKRLSKQNDAHSAADMSEYKPSKFQENFGAKSSKPGSRPGSKPGFKSGGSKGGKPGPGGAKGGVKKPMKRPGKAARAGQKGGKGRK